MNRLPIVQTLKTSSGDEYDLLLCTLGYESRARFIAETQALYARRKIAFGFKAQQVLRFDANESWFKAAGFDVIMLDEEDVRAHLQQTCLAAIRDKRSLRLCCDISSMSRYRIAVVVDTLRALGPDLEVAVDFLYAIAKFTPPPEPLFANVHVGPVLPSFAGWSAEPELPVSAVVGLGYEPDKALGAVEHLQASEIWTFEPVSSIPEYTASLHQANRTLLQFVPEKCRLQYQVERPYTLFSALRALASSSLLSSNPVILPFGPKLFTLVALLVGCSYADIAVWRVSAGIHEPPIDRQAHGFVTGLSVDFVRAAATAV